MADQKKNSYEDDDLKSVVDQFEKLDEEAATIMAAAKAKCGPIRQKQADLKSEAVTELGIPRSSLKAIIDTRRTERKLKKIASKVPDEETEVFKDMVSILGEFSNTPLGGAAVAAADERSEEAEKVQAANRDEGQKALGDIGGKVH